MVFQTSLGTPKLWLVWGRQRCKWFTNWMISGGPPFEFPWICGSFNDSHLVMWCFTMWSVICLGKAAIETCFCWLRTTSITMVMLLWVSYVTLRGEANDFPLWNKLKRLQQLCYSCQWQQMAWSWFMVNDHLKWWFMIVLWWKSWLNIVKPTNNLPVMMFSHDSDWFKDGWSTASDHHCLVTAGDDV